MKKAVLFDCDGVLINTETLGYETMTIVFNRAGLSYTPEERAERLTGRSAADSKKLLQQDYEAVHNKPLPEGFFERARADYYAHVQKNLKPIPGAQDLLTKLQRSKVHIAVVSNGEMESLDRKLTKSGFKTIFSPHIYSKDLVDRPKPAPDIYEYSMRALGVEARDCIVIEDSPTGILAAKAAGAYVIGFTGDHKMTEIMARQHKKAGADETYDTMADITRRLADLLGLSGPNMTRSGPSPV